MMLQNSAPNKTSGVNDNSAKKMGSGSKSNIMAVDESVQSMVDFDLSDSKFTTGLFESNNRDQSPGLTEKLNLTKQGTEGSMLSAIKFKETPASVT